MADLRAFLKAFEAIAIEPCRKVEPLLAICTDEKRGSELLAYHERLSVDLDKFDRQISSFALSGDPTVLLMLGKRILGELRGHLAMEREFLSGVRASS